ncbi:MAG: DPP IV N-terminal domain-containing protein [Pseudomonadota bacterium]
MTTIKKLFFLLIIALPCSLSASGRVYINIGSPEFKKPVIAFYSKSSDIKSIESVVISDLILSNIFIILPKDTMPEAEQRSDIASWSASGAEYLVFLERGDSNISIKLFNALTSEQIMDSKMDEQDSYIDTAHDISDAIFKKLTGEKSIFKTKIAFTCKKDGYKNLYTMDYDGRRIKQLTFFKSIIISPSWSPDGENIAYARYEKRHQMGVGRITNQNLYMFNLRRQRETIISEVSGQNSGPSWSPDGKYIAFTMSKGVNPNIYLYNVSSKETTPLVQNRGIDVEPNFSPDGKWLVFSSSKTGNPELYKMDLETKQQTRLTFNRYYNSSPSWSPSGNVIAFAGLDNPFGSRSYFDIFLINPSATTIERLTIDTGNNEDPSWSPNGRHIVFSSTRNGGSDIYLIHNDGTGEKRLTYGMPCYSPDWSI